MKFAVKVLLKPEILDTQGKALQQQLKTSPHSQPQGVKQGTTDKTVGLQLKGCRVGKLIELEVEGTSVEEAKDQVERWALAWLHNPLMETYEIFCEETPPSQAP